MTPRSLRRLPLNTAAALVFVVAVFPVYWMLLTAFRPTRDIQSETPGFLPVSVTLEHFAKAVAADATSSVVASGFSMAVLHEAAFIARSLRLASSSSPASSAAADDPDRAWASVRA